MRKWPKKEQLDFLNWELGVFFHFGIRTFYEGHVDWDLKEMPVEGFCPTELNCDKWIETIERAGAKYAILVCKHHDGFANWPTKYSSYSVANSPWRNGKGDVVKEFVEACRKYHIKVGLYYSPAEFESSKKEPKDYDDYFINQISELLTNYGKIDYLWFDGCGSENHTYDTKRIIAAIRGMQPDILIFNMWDPDTRWVGNESGVTHAVNKNLVSKLDFSIQTDMKEVLEEERFLPVECDCRMRLSNWFYSDNDEDTVKSLDELMGLYYYSVGRGANLLINIGPDRRGLLPDEDAKRLIEFGDEIRRRFSNPLTCDLAEKNRTYTLTFPQETLVNHVVIKENLEMAEKVQRFKIYIYPFSYGERILVYEGYTIGHKRICQFPTIRTKKIDIVIEKEIDTAILDEIMVYYVEA